MHLQKNVFQLHTTLMWTVNDFPTYADCQVRVPRVGLRVLVMPWRLILNI